MVNLVNLLTTLYVCARTRARTRARTYARAEGRQRFTRFTKGRKARCGKDFVVVNLVSMEVHRMAYWGTPRASIHC